MNDVTYVNYNLLYRNYYSHRFKGNSVDFQKLISNYLEEMRTKEVQMEQSPIIIVGREMDDKNNLDVDILFSNSLPPINMEDKLISHYVINSGFFVELKPHYVINYAIAQGQLYDIFKETKTEPTSFPMLIFGAVNNKLVIRLYVSSTPIKEEYVL